MNPRSRSLLAFVSLVLVAACGTPQRTESTPNPSSSSPPPAASESPAPVDTADAGSVSEAVDASAMDAASEAPVADAGSVSVDAGASDARTGTTRAGSGTRTGTGSGSGSSAGAGAGGNVANGRSAFQRACNRCHPNGEEDTGPRINNINWTEARMRTQIRQGSGGMRPIPASRLSDADLTDLLAYLRTTHAVR